MKVTSVPNGFKLENKTALTREEMYFELQEHESLLRYYIELSQKDKNFLNRAILNFPCNGFKLIKKFKEKQSIC